MSKTRFDYILETKASPEELAHRERLYELFRARPLPDDQLLTVLGLYMRSSALAKILFLNELYQQILEVPGSIVELGCWWGQNLVVFENLRAIYEPFNQNRRIVGFDTFGGYPAVSGQDRASETIKVGGYTVSEEYQAYLDSLIDFHERDNVLRNVKKHQTVKGDAAETFPRFLEENPETIVALAYFDMALYEPTRVCLSALKPHLIPGSVVMLDEFNSHAYPGETMAFKEVFRDMRYTVKRSRYMTDRTMMVIQ